MYVVVMKKRTKLSSYLLNLLFFDVLVAIGTQSPYFSPYAVAGREDGGAGLSLMYIFK